MGLDYSVAKFLFERSKEAPLGRILVLGRQTVYMTPREMADVRAWSGANLAPAGFADDFFRALGATEISFLDRSCHESADILHDLNQPLASDFHAKFDTVLDGGTLEHVFNFPVALKTCMEAMREGGRLFIFSPVNSMMGHGFYQFTPELFYRCLAPAYGFQVERLLIRHDSVWFEARNPPWLALGWRRRRRSRRYCLFRQGARVLGLFLNLGRSKAITPMAAGPPRSLKAVPDLY